MEKLKMVLLSLSIVVALSLYVICLSASGNCLNRGIIPKGGRGTLSKETAQLPSDFFDKKIAKDSLKNKKKPGGARKPALRKEDKSSEPWLMRKVVTGYIAVGVLSKSRVHIEAATIHLENVSSLTPDHLQCGSKLTVVSAEIIYEDAELSQPTQGKLSTIKDSLVIVVSDGCFLDEKTNRVVVRIQTEGLCASP